jgi:NhaP-type Na+/H+ or K+/H+ antiporter
MGAIILGGLLSGLLIAYLRGKLKSYITPMLVIAGVVFFVAMIVALTHMQPIIAAACWAVFITIFLIFIARTDKREMTEKRLRKMSELRDAFEAGREYQEYKGNANLEEKSWEYTFDKWYERTYNNKSKV